MATRYWLAKVGSRKQVITITVTAFDAATTYKVTMGVNVVSVAGDTNAATTASDLQSALSSSLYGEFQRVNWTVSSAVITGTSVQEGEPFTATASVSGGTGTVSQATTVTNTSPNDVGDANNWSAATLPVTGDSIVIENTDASLLWNLDALAAVDIASCRVLQTFTGNIGLPTDNINGYVEYRPTEFQMQTCTVLYEEQATNLDAGSRKYNVGANACTATFIGNGSGSLGSEVTWWRGTHASNVLNTDGASVVLAALESYTATVATISSVNGSVVRGGVGLGAVTTFTSTDSAFDIQSNVTTLTIDGSNSQWITRNTMTVGTLTAYAGSGTDLSNGTWTTFLLGSQTNTASIDFSQDKRAKTITNKVNIYKGSTFNDPDGRVTMSANFTIPKGRIGDVTFVTAPDKTYGLS